MTLTTKDGKTITLSGMTTFVVKDLEALYNSMHQPDDIIEASISNIIADMVANSLLESCSPQKIKEAVDSKCSFDDCGIGEFTFFINNYLIARTLRVITGEPRTWIRGNSLDLDQFDGKSQ